MPCCLLSRDPRAGAGKPAGWNCDKPRPGSLTLAERGFNRSQRQPRGASAESGASESRSFGRRQSPPYQQVAERRLPQGSHAWEVISLCPRRRTALRCSRDAAIYAHCESEPATRRPPAGANDAPCESDGVIPGCGRTGAWDAAHDRAAESTKVDFAFPAANSFAPAGGRHVTGSDPQSASIAPARAADHSVACSSSSNPAGDSGMPPVARSCSETQTAS
jgi:hypothetical protein